MLFINRYQPVQWKQSKKQRKGIIHLRNRENGYTSIESDARNIRLSTAWDGTYYILVILKWYLNINLFPLTEKWEKRCYLEIEWTWLCLVFYHAIGINIQYSGNRWTRILLRLWLATWQSGQYFTWQMDWERSRLLVFKVYRYQHL